MTSNKPIANWTIDILLSLGVKTIICSPGSRNAPLVMAAVAREELEVITILDERSAAFLALGYIQEQARPVAVCCTSGSALANYHPSVLEAFHSRLPLIVVSADRPANRILKGEGQTCVQPDFYTPHIGASVHIDEQTPEEAFESVFQSLNDSIIEHFPVHINCAFQEPLYETIARFPKRSFQAKELAPTESIPWGFLEQSLTTGGETAVLIGQLSPQQSLVLRKILSLEHWRVPVFADPTSGLLDHPMTRSMNQVLAYSPSVVLSIGGQWVNKQPKFHLRSIGVKQHIHWDPYQSWEVLDAPSFLHIKTNVKEFERLVQWIQPLQPEIDKKQPLEGNLPWSDAAVAQQLFETIHPDDVLHLGNSTAVRYFEFFPCRANVLSNRGIAGIDGSLSTAVGAALAAPSKRHWCLIGDQSFIYDSNALNVPSLPDNLTVVVLNNGVGAIFDWLPGTQKADRRAQKVFSNPIQVNLQGIAMAFGVNYQSVSNFGALKKSLHNASGCMIIDVDTKLAPNADVAKKLMS